MTLPEHFKLVIADGPGISKILNLLPLIFIFAMYIISSLLKNKKPSGPPARPLKNPLEPAVTPAGSRGSSREQQQRQASQRQPGRVIAVPKPPNRAKAIGQVRVTEQPRIPQVRLAAKAKTISQTVSQPATIIPVARSVRRTLKAQPPRPQPKPAQQASRLRPRSSKPQPKPTPQVSRPLIPQGRNALAQAVIYAEILGKPLALRSDQNDLQQF